MKVAPVYRALAATGKFALTLVHTGQHYDKELSEVFFLDLGLPKPDVNLEVGSGSHGAQTARVLERFEAIAAQRQPDLVVVVGDVNSTLACALAASKLVYASGRRPRVAHIEAGLRSFDRTMPEEINRILTDSIADFLFATEEDALANLAREGISGERVFLVGNVMIDSLLTAAERAVALKVWERLGLGARHYAVVTLHRPSNVDDARTLGRLLEVLERVADRVPVVFPAHPRTTARLGRFGPRSLTTGNGSLRILPPLGYLEFLSLMSQARVVLTDSGGIQEETTVLGIPCVTLRENTERPVTVTEGTNTLAGTDPERILTAVDRALRTELGPRARPRLWDGNAAVRIAEVLESHF
jgi:UDP-N-acetylglucosamine 2-epimerase (non-hydrolysing)